METQHTSNDIRYSFSPFRKTLLTVFLLGSVAIIAGQFFLARSGHALPAAGVTPNDVVALSPSASPGASGGYEGSVGVAEAAGTQKEAASATRTLRELRIPALGIKAGVQDLGLTADGRMGSPTNSYEVGWFRYGTKPGERGNAVIAGHLNTIKSPEGVFKELYRLTIGDKVEVTDSDGHTSTFVVTGTKHIPYDSVASANAEIFGPTMKRRLNLITCTGSWIPEKKTYTERLVVFTELVE